MAGELSDWSRRRLLKTAGGAALLSGFRALAETARTKLIDIQTMTLTGPRTYVLVKVVADNGHYGVAEAYGLPSIGVKEQIEALKPLLVGKDPLEIDAIYTFMGIGGRELSGTLLGGRFRDKVRVYDHASPRDMLDKASCREWAAKIKADPSGFTAHKIGFRHTDPATDSARDLGNRVLTTKELMEIAQGFENCREAIGWDHDLMVHCHWEYDLRTSIQLADAVAPIKPLWLEDPLPVDYSESWRRLCASSRVPICTGENLERRAGFKDFIIYQGCDILNPDLRNSGGFLETKRIADMADTFGLPMATHNTGSQLHTWANCQWAASIRDYIACETITGQGGWMDQLLLLDGPYIKDGHIGVTGKPGLGVELNPDVVKAHLAEGERWWG
jgi:L-alanine-DL-glutamate epimerase-like enolase superfamily enzyme